LIATRKNFLEYQIIATLGPASQEVETWRAMLAAGASAFRLNTSHLSLPELDAWLGRLEGFLTPIKPTPSLVLDLQGSKWRLGSFDPFELIEDQRVELHYTASTRDPGILPVPHPDFFLAASLSNGQIALNDARARLAVETSGPGWLRARVVRGGEIAPRKGITFEASEYRQENLSEKDRAILGKTRGLDFVRYAISYVKDALEMRNFRQIAGAEAALIAKLERGTAVDEATQFAGVADELWLCRGDLGAELGLKGMAEAALHFTERVRDQPLPALLAGQVLEHMTLAPVPTRSEVVVMYEALVKGYRGFVLSDETAIGRHPVESCRIAGMFS
jgi:pyruvate kinase